MNKLLFGLLTLCVVRTHCALIPTEPNDAEVRHEHDHGDHDGHDHDDDHGGHDHGDHGGDEGSDHDDDDHDHDHHGTMPTTTEENHGDHEHGDHEDDDHGDHEGHEHGDHEDDHGEQEGHDDHEDHEHGDHEDDHGDHEGHEHGDHHEEHEDHSDHNHNLDPFAELLVKLDVNKMDSSALVKLLAALSNKTKCQGEGKEECSTCTTGSALLQASGLSDHDSLDQVQFEKVAYILTHYLFYGLKKICDNTGGIINHAEAEHELFSSQFVCHNRTETIVHEIEDNSCPRMIECFKPFNTVFEEKECFVKEEAATKGVLTRLLLSIITPDCKCVLPEAGFFNIEIMESYGTSDSEMTLQGFKDVLHDLNIGKVGETESEAGHEGHNHRKKRDTHEHDHEEHATDECYTGEEFFEIYGVDKSDAIDTTQFTIMCPALIQQVVSGNCRANPTSKKTSDDGNYTDAHKYGYGTAAVFIISMLAFVGLLVFPTIGSSGYKLAMQFFIALGVGTMSGDAILHIIPEAS